MGTKFTLQEQTEIMEILEKSQLCAKDLIGQIRKISKLREPQIDLEGFSLLPLRREVRVEDKILTLPPKEFQIFNYLAERPNIPVSRRELLKDVWGIDFDPETNTIDVTVNFLRKRLKDVNLNSMIRTVSGVGYVLESK
jgi:two-component system OmpR family response regulator